jgi:SNF2 family DNA or RNA helicase
VARQSKVQLTSGLDWKPTGYMKRAVRWVMEHPASGLFLDPGLRKTSITLQAFRLLKHAGLVRRMLVVAPIRVCYHVWPSEIDKWLQFQDLKFAILHDRDKDDELLADETVDVYIINPEGLEWLLGRQVTDKKGRVQIKPNWKRFALLDTQIFVLDESSKFKNTQTKRFKLLRPFLPKFLRRLILTGSPTPKNYLDLFGQVYIMDLGQSFGPYISHYRNRYFDPSGFGGYTWKLREGSDKKIQKLIKPLVMRLEAEDYLQIPQLVEQDLVFDLDPKARAIYDEMEDELIAILESGETITSPTAAAARTKCSEIANGFIYKNKDGIEIPNRRNSYETLHGFKLDALEEILAEIQGQPTLIFYWFQADLDLIRSRLGKDTPSLSEVSMKKGKLLEDAWNRNELPILLANPASVGHGLNMQEGNARYTVWFTIPDDYDSYDQAIRRLRRSGNLSSHVYAYRLIAKNTVDIAKAKMMARKGASQKDFLDAMKSYRPRKKK